MTIKKKIGVGIIGANPNRGWAMRGHIPALKSLLDDYEIMAVCTTRIESAKEAAKHFSIPHAYSDPHELCNHPEVDLVVITVKVPDHYHLVKTAISAGKHVYCEWPLGRTTNETLKLKQMAIEKGVGIVVGLQARTNPVINYVKDLISNGYVGKVLSVNADFSLSHFGETITQPYAYLFDENNGANHLTVASGHILDVITYCFGNFTEVSAMLTTQFKEIKVIETDEILDATSPDHVLVNGIIENGAIVSIFVRNGNVGKISIEIVGTEGELIISSKESIPAGIQMDELKLTGVQGKNNGIEELSIPSHYHHVPLESVNSQAYNVAQLYTYLNKFLNTGVNQPNIPSINDAIDLHKLIDRIKKSAELGKLQ